MPCARFTDDCDGASKKRRRYMSKKEFEALMQKGRELRKLIQETTLAVKRLTAEDLRFRVD